MSAGWKHGDSVDEQVKCHPLLKPYKALSEKVNCLSDGALAAGGGGVIQFSTAAHAEFCLAPYFVLYLAYIVQAN